jgi:hypothetical protein
MERFSSGQPVVINTHRINYVGVNAGKHRRQLDELLNYAERRFPDVMYMTSEELGRIIERHDNILIVKRGTLKYCALVTKDILLYLPGVWYPVLLAVKGVIPLFLIYQRLKYFTLDGKN